MSLSRIIISYRLIKYQTVVKFLSPSSFVGARNRQEQLPFRTYSNQSITASRYGQSNGNHENNWKRKGSKLLTGTLGLFSFGFFNGKKEDEANEKDTEELMDIWADFKVTLYQYQTCPFCTKARTFLQYHQIPFEIVEVHPIFKKEIKFSEKYKKVPIVTIETKQGRHELQDSSLIISILGTYMRNGGKRNLDEIMADYPSSEILDDDGKTKEVVLNKYWILVEEPYRPAETLDNDPRGIEVQWRQWTDDHLVHLISPNVYRTYMESYQAFAHHVELGRFKGTWEGVVAKVFGSLAMWMISKKLKKKYCTSEDVRMDLYRACNEWRKALGKKKFMGGDEPNLADLSVYAVLNVMDGLVSFEDLKQYTKIMPWYLRVKDAIDERRETS